MTVGAAGRIYAGAEEPERHCRHRFFLCQPSPQGKKPGGALPLSQRENAVVQFVPGNRVVLLLWMRRRGRRDHVRPPDRKSGLYGGHPLSGAARRASGAGKRGRFRPFPPEGADSGNQPGNRPLLSPDPDQRTREARDGLSAGQGGYPEDHPAFRPWLRAALPV